MAFAAQLVEHRRPSLTALSTSTVGVENGGVVSSVASVSASEEEMSDAGNSYDDASSADGATILGTDLHFVDL